MRPTKRLLSLALTVLIAHGCSTVRELTRAQRPTVTVAQARIAGLTFETVDLVMDIKVANPNPFSLPLAGLDYDLSLDGRSVLTGNQPQSVSVPGGGHRVVTLPLSLRFRELYASVSSLGGRDEAPYGVSCGLSFDLPVAGRTRIPVRHTGSLPLVKLPRVALDGLRVKDLSLVGATVEIVLGVDNPNAFDLALKRVDYALDINGASWATGRTQRTDSIARKQRGELRIPVTLDFLRIGSGIYEIVSGSSQVSYKLSGSLDVGTSLPLLRQASIPISGTGSIRLSR